MRQRWGRNTTPMAYCKAHGSYPLNFSYRGMVCANACPKCHPTWQAELRTWRDRMLAERDDDGEPDHG